MSETDLPDFHLSVRLDYHDREDDTHGCIYTEGYEPAEIPRNLLMMLLRFYTSHHYRDCVIEGIRFVRMGRYGPTKDAILKEMDMQGSELTTEMMQKYVGGQVEVIEKGEGGGRQRCQIQAVRVESVENFDAGFRRTTPALKFVYEYACEWRDGGYKPFVGYREQVTLDTDVRASDFGDGRFCVTTPYQMMMFYPPDHPTRVLRDGTMERNHVP